jgi:hypothetical protein
MLSMRTWSLLYQRATTPFIPYARARLLRPDKRANYFTLIHSRAHYQRPLEEAIQTHASQWPKAWQGKNPLHGGRTFATMPPEERVCQCNANNSLQVKGTDNLNS